MSRVAEPCFTVKQIVPREGLILHGESKDSTHLLSFYKDFCLKSGIKIAMYIPTVEVRKGVN